MKTKNLATGSVCRIFLALACVLVCLKASAADNIEEIARLRAAADSLHSIGRTDSAAMIGEKVIALSEKTKNPTLIVGANSSQGVFLRSLGRVEEALGCYDKALAIVASDAFRQKPDEEAIEEAATLYVNLSVFNLDMQQKNDAAKNALAAARWVEKSTDAETRSMTYGVVGSVFTACKDLVNAMKYQSMAYGDALESGNKEAAFRAAAYAMLVADRSDKKTEAELWREKCKSLLPEIQSMMAVLVYYQAECSISLVNNDYKNAIEWFKKILALDGMENLPFVQLDCYGNMHEAYAQLGDYRNAYDVLLKGYELRNKLWEEEKSQSLQDITVKYDAKEKELALAQSQASHARTLVWLFAAIALLLVLVVVFTVYASGQKRRRMRQYIQGLENERRRISAELHDGVCNDLLAIQMKVQQEESAETATAMLDTCREAVRRISHELMPPEFTYASLDEVLRYFVSRQDEAAENISINYSSSLTGSRWEDVPDNVALEVYRIVQEAVGNAVKHSGASEIAVTLSLDANNLAASVVDNGTYHSSDKKGIGEESMRRRAISVGGSLEVKTADNGGTEVILTVKTP